MKKRNTGINLFKLFSMFMIALLHVLGIGGITELPREQAAIIRFISCRMRHSARSTATHSSADILCLAKR